MLDKRLLDIMVCPKCKGELEYKSDINRLLCKKCKLAYKIEDDIPIMLIDEAESIEGDLYGN
ncbi:Trm112 family protein [candidate division WOR-3 bacterium]|nr:Trm112 family protein [candidate division WOR-3 bacterium]